MKVAIINSMTGVSDKEIALICEGLQSIGAQAAQSLSRPDPFSCDVVTPPEVRALAPGEPIPTDEVPFHLDDKCDVQDAAGYHDKYGTGQPYAVIGRDAAPNGELFCADGDSVFAIALHELLELVGNPKANRWVQSNFLDKRTGRVFPLVAPELCDPFQGVYDKFLLKDGTAVDRVAWAYPAFFQQERVQSTQLDSHGAASEPLTILPGGYQIAAVIGRESSVFGRLTPTSGRVCVCEHHEKGLTERHRVRKLAPNSRTMRIVNSIS